MNPDELKYTSSHEWVKIDGNHALVGITDHAQEQLNDIVYVELPEVGDTFKKGEAFAVVESVKSSTDVYMPLSGKVVKVNEDVVDSPELLNEDPYKNWLVEIEIEDASEADSLMDAAAYEELLKKED